MMDPLNFKGPLLKAERAEHHIGHLEKIFAAYKDANLEAFNNKRFGSRGEELRTFGLPLPDHTPTVLGDALHNLRASLDHAYCILVEANGGQVNEYTKFPFAKKHGARNDLKASIEGHAKNGNAPSRAVIDYIFDTIQPFVDGAGADLVAIHVLDIADKHMILLPTHHRTEVVNVTIGGNTLNVVTEGFGTGMLLINTPAPNNPNSKMTVTPCFGRGQPLEWQPIIPTLKRLHARVVETLAALSTI